MKRETCVYKIEEISCAISSIYIHQKNTKSYKTTINKKYDSNKKKKYDMIKHKS